MYSMSEREHVMEKKVTVPESGRLDRARMETECKTSEVSLLISSIWTYLEKAAKRKALYEGSSKVKKMTTVEFMLADRVGFSRMTH